MKLYTEEQLRAAITDSLSCFYAKNKHYDDLINVWMRKHTPIELPSDEEISQLNPFRLGGGNYNGSAAYQWQKGAKWMRDKIINQKK